VALRVVVLLAGMVFVTPELILGLVVRVEMVFVTPEMALPAEAVFLPAVLMTLEFVLPVETALVPVVLKVVLRVGMLLPVETVLILTAVLAICSPRHGTVPVHFL
jgi:hypothetical protein